MSRKPAKKSGGGGRLFVVLLIIAAIIGAAYLLNKCGGLGGFGLGTGTGTATGTASGSASTPPTASSIAPVTSGSANAGPQEPYIIRVAGTTCQVGTAHETKDCPEACTKADEATKGMAKREVRLSPSKGSQEVVETLKKCLQEKGLKVLEVDD